LHVASVKSEDLYCGQNNLKDIMIVNPKSSFVSIDSYKNYDDYINFNDDMSKRNDIRDFQFDAKNKDQNLINNNLKNSIQKEYLESSYKSQNLNNQMIFDK
jgi:hypothetical protein